MKYCIKLGEACATCQSEELIDSISEPEPDYAFLRCGSDYKWSKKVDQQIFVKPRCPQVRILNLFTLAGLPIPQEFTV